LKDGAAADLFHRTLLHKDIRMPVIKSPQRQIFAAFGPFVDKQPTDFPKDNRENPNI